MASEAQQNKGYELPEPVTGWDLICVRLKIPNAPEYRAAFRGQLKGLTEWWNWEKTGDTRGSRAATYWRQIIHDNLIIEDCDVLEFLEDCDDMAKFKICWFQSEDGPILRYSLNDGCTWNDVLNCDGTIPGTDDGEPQNPPVDPINEPGVYPPPDIVYGDRCRVINSTFYLAFDRALLFFSNVINISAANRAYALQQTLDSWDEAGNGLQWFTPFSQFMQKYIPYIVQIENVIDSATWGDVIACIVSGCYPSLVDITREIMDCIADGIDAAAPADEDGLAYFSYLADFFRIYPLSVIRADAFRHSINPALSSVCPDCGTPAPVSCAPKFITFDAGSDPYTINIGAEGVGKNGIGAQSIDLPPGTFSNDASYVKDNGVRVIVPLGASCNVKTVRWQMKILLSNPTSNVNVYITPPTIIRLTNSGNLTSLKQPAFKRFYGQWSTEWFRASQNFDPSVIADTVEITVWLATKYQARVIQILIDEIEVIME